MIRIGRDANNPMHVIGHHNEGVQFYVVTRMFGAIPFLGNNTPMRVQLHPPLHHLTEEAHAVVGADGDKICRRASVIPRRQAKRSAIVFVRVKGHRIDRL